MVLPNWIVKILLRERKSRLVVAIKNLSRQAEVTKNTLINYMKNNLPKTMYTLTLDNNSAFALHEKIENQI